MKSCSECEGREPGYCPVCKKTIKRIPLRLWVGKCIMDGEDGFSYSVTASDTSVTMTGAYQTEVKCAGGFWIDVEA